MLVTMCKVSDFHKISQDYHKKIQMPNIFFLRRFVFWIIIANFVGKYRFEYTYLIISNFNTIKQ